MGSQLSPAQVPPKFGSLSRKPTLCLGGSSRSMHGVQGFDACKLKNPGKHTPHPTPPGGLVWPGGHGTHSVDALPAVRPGGQSSHRPKLEAVSAEQLSHAREPGDGPRPGSQATHALRLSSATCGHVQGAHAVPAIETLLPPHGSHTVMFITGCSPNAHAEGAVLPCFVRHVVYVMASPSG